MTEKNTNTKLFYDVGYYSITINPEDRYQHFGMLGINRMQKFRELMRDTLYPWKTDFGIDYYFRIELSEPRDINNTRGPRLHLHGVILFTSRKSVYNFLLECLPKLAKFTHVNIDTINDINQWEQYVEKQRDIVTVKPMASDDDLFSRVKQWEKDKKNFLPEGGAPPLGETPPEEENCVVQSTNKSKSRRRIRFNK